MPSERPLRTLCLMLFTLCVPFAGGCRQEEQEQSKAFIEFLEVDAPAAMGTDRVWMSDEVRKKIGKYGKQFDLIAMYSKELSDINAWLAGEKARIAVQGAIPMDKIGSERARIEQILAALFRSIQHIEAVKIKADAAKAALKQPEDVRAAFDRRYEREVSGYAAASQSLYVAQRDFYADALRMSIFIEKHKDKIQFKNKTVTIEDQAFLHEYNALQKTLWEKSQKMHDALASNGSVAR